jgi:hypothetical protein
VIGCGKKGSPLAPFVHIPEGVPKLAATRVGNEVFVTMTVPSHNIDSSTPADVGRIEIYAVTANTPPPTARFLELATPVATIPVAAAPEPGSPVTAPPPASAATSSTTPSTTPPAAMQGAAVTLRDLLTSDALTPTALPPPPVRETAAGAPGVPAAPAAAPGPLQRSYLAIAFSQRGRPGPPARFDLPLTLLPEPPTGLVATYNSESMLLAWQPSGGLIGFILDAALPIEANPLDDPALAPSPSASASPAPVPPSPARAGGLPGTAAAPAAVVAPPPLALPDGPTRYFVYRTIEPDPLVLPPPGPRQSPPWQLQLPTPLNTAPLAALVLTDTLLLEREQCYEVRAVRGTAPNLVAGVPSERYCIRAVDTFAPAVPTGLSAVAGEGSISLIWEPNIEEDLGGYVVLRGEAGGATLQPLTAAPIADARYTDRAVTAGVRYVYAVVAVDSRVPVPNASAMSTRVEETGR